MNRRLTILVLALAGLLLAAPAAGAHPKHGRLDPTPLIFVHGGAGSGAQFESQALRFTSNGYPSNYIRVLEYDSTFGVNTMDQVLARSGGDKRDQGRGAAIVAMRMSLLRSALS